MTEIVTFCSQLPEKEEVVWREEISHLTNEFRIIPFRQLSNSQRKSIRVAIVANPKPEDLLTLTNLRWVQSLWAGVENLLGGLADSNIKIVRMKDPKLTSSMAEAVLAWILYLHRDMPAYKYQQQRKEWKPRKLVDIKDRRISILGLGELGKASATKLLEYGFEVNGWSRNPVEIPGINCFKGKRGFESVLERADILICLLPLTTETTGLLDKQALSKMPKGSSLINFSRGPIIDEKDLIQLLHEQHINHAVLDVFNIEPLPENHPFWEMESVTILPHISAPTNIYTASKIVVKNISQYLKTSVCPEAINLARGY